MRKLGAQLPPVSLKKLSCGRMEKTGVENTKRDFFYFKMRGNSV